MRRNAQSTRLPIRSQPRSFNNRPQYGPRANPRPRFTRVQSVPRPIRRSYAPSRRAVARRNARPARPRVALSQCTRQYAATLIDPFNHHGHGVPCVPSMPSWKTFVFARGQMSTGSAGIGWLILNPLRAIANDGNSIRFTTPAFAGTTIDPVAAGVTIISGNSPYALSQFSGQELGISYRIVSAGIRMRYAGAEIERGGTITAVQHPNHANLDNATIANLNSLSVAKRYAVDRNWTSVQWCPVFPDEYVFRTDSGALAIFPMAIMVEAPNPAIPLLFDFEVTVNMELVGSPVRGMTPSMSDSQGFSAVQAAIQGAAMVTNSPNTGPNPTVQRGFLVKVEDMIINSASRVINNTMSWLGTKAGAMIEGAMEDAFEE